MLHRFLHAFLHWRKQRQYDLFREWYQVFVAAQAWNALRCPFCRCPAAMTDANFCAHCGSRLCIPALPQAPDFYTEPMLAIERPLMTYCHTKHQGEKKAMQHAVQAIQKGWTGYDRL